MAMDERDREHDTELRRVAAIAAAEVVQAASNAAQQVAATAANAAHNLLELTRADLSYIKADLSEIKVRLDSKYVTLEAFQPVRSIVYGLVALILVAVVTGLIALLIKK